MANFFIILLLGGALGWLYTARTANFTQCDAVINILTGLLASMGGAAISQPTLYAGLSGQTFAYSTSVTLIALGALELIRDRIRR